jgi:predicted ATPase
MHVGMKAAEKIGMKLLRPTHLGYLASAQVWAGEEEAGLSLLAQALQAVEETGERVFESELHRFRGNLHLRSRRESEAETEFFKAIEIAQRQQAKSWELRAATSLAQMRCDQGNPIEARGLVAPIYNWFTEGFDTPDLKRAKALLDELA